MLGFNIIAGGLLVVLLAAIGALGRIMFHFTWPAVSGVVVGAMVLVLVVGLYFISRQNCCT